MTADANIVIGIKGQIEGGKVIKRTLDDINNSANQATKQTEQFDNQMKKTNRTAQLFGRALGALGGTLIVRTLGRVNDEFTVLDTSIKNVTKSSEEYDRVFSSLFSTAQANGDVFSGLAATYQKLNVSLEDSVKNSIDLTKVTEILSRGFAASGTSAQTAAGASLQLTQGLATNFKAAGQELNSIIEGAPLLAKAIAIELGGKGATDLKKFAEEGSLTAQTFLEALISAEGAVKAFEIPPTIERSIQRVKNEFLRLNGESQSMRDISIAVAEGFNFVAENMFIVANALAVLINGFRAFSNTVSGIMDFVVAGIIDGFLSAGRVIEDVINGAIVAINKLTGKKIELVSFSSDISRSELAGAAQISANDNFSQASDFANATASGVSNIFEKNNIKSSTSFIPSGSGVSSSGGGTGSSSTKLSSEAKELQKIIKDTRSEQEELIDRINDLNKLRGFAQTEKEVNAVDRALAAANEQLKTASTEIPGIDDKFKDLRASVDDFADSAGGAFGQIVTGAKSAKEAIVDLLRSTASNLASEGFSSLIGGLFGGSKSKSSGAGGSLLSGIGAGIGSLFGFASGGDMVLGGNAGFDSNILSLNGSPIARTGRGETMSIKPAGSSGGNANGVNVYQTINVSTGVQETVQAELVAFLPVIEKSTKAAIMEDKQRGIS